MMALKNNLENQRVNNYYSMLIRKFKFKVDDHKKRSIFYELLYNAEQQTKKMKLIDQLMKKQKVHNHLKSRLNNF